MKTRARMERRREPVNITQSIERDKEKNNEWES